MRKAVFGLLILALAGATAWTMSFRYTSGTTGISVTSTSAATQITDNHSGGTGLAFRAMFISVCSDEDSASTCTYDIDGVATDDDTPVRPGYCDGRDWNPGDGPSTWSQFSVKCPGSGTATFYVEAGR